MMNEASRSGSAGNALLRRDFMKRASAWLGGCTVAAIPWPTGRAAIGAAQAGKKPDVLFIAIEDVSPHRFGCWGDPVCQTPNIDGFAASAVRFDLAHCSAPPCNPSRTSLLSGLRPLTTGITGNENDWSKVLKPGTTLPEHFSQHGYETVRIGKIFHKGNGNDVFDDTSRWDLTVSEREGLGPVTSKRRPERGPGIEYGKKRDEAKKKGIIIRGGSPFNYGPSGLKDIEEQDGGTAEQAVRILSQEREKPLFLALGFHKPHLPFDAPDKYFEMYPPEKMVLPKNEGSDANGMPLDSSKLSETNPHTLEQWREAIAAHYACLTFVDAQLGRVFKALEESGKAKDTVVVIWSDHGFMLGEHYLWRKGPLYDHSTMVALIMKVPGVTKPGVCRRPVELIDLFPTLADVCGLPIPEGLEAISMKPLLKDPRSPWKKAALISQGRDGFSVCTEKWRYNEFGNGRKVELFDRENDPGEFKNLAEDSLYADEAARLRGLLKGGWKACLPEGYTT